MTPRSPRRPKPINGVRLLWIVPPQEPSNDIDKPSETVSAELDLWLAKQRGRAP